MRTHEPTKGGIGVPDAMRRRGFEQYVRLGTECQRLFHGQRLRRHVHYHIAKGSRVLLVHGGIWYIFHQDDGPWMHRLGREE
jgi:hypothetical protein